ncbi:MAG: hypothetical protein E4H01_00055 [Lysobacterales bacterium]|nr:MAG: hypothetical protein E4H01_00055 [Xanthomonadales bacterium]
MADQVGIHRVEGTEVTTVAQIPPAQSAGKSKDLNEFIDLVAVALVDYQKKLAIAPSERLTLREAYPKDPVEKPDIGIGLALFRVIGRQFFNTTNDGTRRTWRPRLREEVQHPNDTNLRLSVYVAEMENVVEFRIVSPHAKRANEWAEFFEGFFMAYVWYFKEMGIAECHYQERLEDTIEVIGGSELHVRPLRYYVRTQLVSQKVEKKIDEVLVQYDTGTLLRQETINEQYGVDVFSIIRDGSNS